MFLEFLTGRLQADGDETQLQMTIAAQLNQLPKKGQVSSAVTLQDVLRRVVATNKAYYELLSKLGKRVGAELASRPEYEEPLFEGFQADRAVVNQSIAEHMCRSGFFAAGEAFRGEAAVALPEAF